MSNFEQQPNNDAIQEETFAQNMQRVLDERRAKEFPFTEFGLRSETIEEYDESSQRRAEAIRKAEQHGPHIDRGLGNTAISRFDLEGENDG